MNAHAKAHLLAAQILANNLEGVRIGEIIDALHLARTVREIATCVERRYTKNGRTCVAGPRLPGYVAVVHGGRDCDGVETNNEVIYCDATLHAVQAEVDRLYQWADGPVWWRIERPSVALKLTPTWRDRVMEAFEDGHPYSI